MSGQLGCGEISPEVQKKTMENSRPVKQEKNVLHWFRRGLRLHDNQALTEALKNATTFRCVYILDPWFAASQHSINKWRFLIQCLEDLDQSLRKLNSRLFVIHGQPADVLSRYIQKWGVTHLSFEDDPEPFGRERDTVIKTLAKEANVEVIVRVAHTLYDIKDVIQANKNRIPFTYKKFQRIMLRMDPPLTPVPKITKETIGKAVTPMHPDQDDLYAVPTLDQLGFDTHGLTKASVWIGGESEALYRLDRHLERKAWVASFEQPRMTTQSMMASPTGLSPYLRFGCLSARLFYWKLHQLFCKLKREETPPASLFGQLYWREFFYTVASDNPKFDRMIGNPICLQIPWNVDPVALAKWAEAKTGFPWIDAIMTQLKQEGWIHPLARHSVACFLTRGDLWLSWEDGMKIFDELLLDADWSTNAGMWMWLSCSSFFHQFFYTYDPVSFGKRIDPNGDYIRKYLPVLRSYPSEYIFEPWTAPQNIQELVKCVIGRDYPKPMIDHQKAVRINMERMKAVYQQVITKTRLSKTNQQKALHEFMTRMPRSSALASGPKHDGNMPSFGE